jgi:hypothetical protein
MSSNSYTESLTNNHSLSLQRRGSSGLHAIFYFYTINSTSTGMITPNPPEILQTAAVHITSLQKNGVADALRQHQPHSLNSTFNPLTS